MRRSRQGFTLTELLVVMAIIAVIATIAFAALANANADAKRARTKAQIARLHAIVMQRWESYRTRRVPLSTALNADPNTAALQRLDAIRDLMRMELPERKSDVLDGPLVVGSVPALTRGYLGRAQSVGNWTTTHQGAECLYMIVEAAGEGGEFLEYFNENEIGDVDNDGMPEILDGWGQPIEFLRWAPGFRSPMQDGIPANGLDAFDPRQVDRNGAANNYRIFPLIVSAGPDGAYDMVVDISDTNPLRYRTINNNPYYNPGGSDLMGTFIANADGDPYDGTFDNITNHTLTTATD